jgi:hypothetical protein
MSVPPAKHGCTIEKAKRPPGLQRSADRGDRGVEVVDIGKPEIAGRHVEAAVEAAQGPGHGHVAVKVADAELLILLDLPGPGDQGA